MGRRRVTASFFKGAIYLKTFFRILIENEEFYCDSIQITASGQTVSFRATFPPIPILLEIPANTYATIQIKNETFKTLSSDGWITAADAILVQAFRVKRPDKNEVALDFVSPMNKVMNIMLINFLQSSDEVLKELMLRNHNFPKISKQILGSDADQLLTVPYILTKIMSDYFGLNLDNQDTQVNDNNYNKDTMFYSLVTYLSLFQNDFKDLEDAFNLSRRIFLGDPNFLEGNDLAYVSDATFSLSGETQPVNSPVLSTKIQKDILKSMFRQSILDYGSRLQSNTSLSQILGIFAGNMEHNLYAQLFPKKISWRKTNSKERYFSEDIEKIRKQYFSDLYSDTDEYLYSSIGQYLFLPDPFNYIPPTSNIIFPSQISSINFQVSHQYPTRVGTTFADTNSALSMTSRITGLYPGPLDSSTYPKLGVTINEFRSLFAYMEDLSYDKIKTLVLPNNLNNRAVGTYYIENSEFFDVLSYYNAIDSSETDSTDKNQELVQGFNDSVALYSRKKYNEEWANSRLMSVQIDFNPYIANGFPAIVVSDSTLYFGRVSSVTHTIEAQGGSSTSITLDNVDQLSYPIEENKWYLTDESYYRICNHSEFYTRIGLKSFGEKIYEDLSTIIESNETSKNDAISFCLKHQKALNQLGYKLETTSQDEKRLVKMTSEEKKRIPRVNNGFDIIKLMKSFILEYLMPLFTFGDRYSYRNTADKNIEIAKNLYVLSNNIDYISTQDAICFLASSNDAEKLLEARTMFDSMLNRAKQNSEYINWNNLSEDYIKINDFKPVMNTESNLDKEIQKFINVLEGQDQELPEIHLVSVAEVRYFVIKLIKNMIEKYTTVLYQQMPVYALNNINDAVWAAYEGIKIFQIVPVINTVNGNKEVRYLAQLRKAKEILKYSPESEVNNNASN